MDKIPILVFSHFSFVRNRLLDAIRLSLLGS